MNMVLEFRSRREENDFTENVKTERDRTVSLHSASEIYKKADYRNLLTHTEIDKSKRKPQFRSLVGPEYQNM